MRNEKTMMLREVLLKKELATAKAEIELLRSKLEKVEKELVEKESKTKRKSYKKKSEKEEE